MIAQIQIYGSKILGALQDLQGQIRALVVTIISLLRHFLELPVTILQNGLEYIVPFLRKSLSALWNFLNLMRVNFYHLVKAIGRFGLELLSAFVKFLRVPFNLIDQNILVPLIQLFTTNKVASAIALIALIVVLVLIIILT